MSLPEGHLLIPNSGYLRHSWLVNANLENAHLVKANLEGAFLANANLRGTILRDANLIIADLSFAKFDENTILPDGTYWTPDIDLKCFTDLTHPNFWRSSHPYSPAYRGHPTSE